MLLFLLHRIMPNIRSRYFQEEICFSQVIFPCLISLSEPREGSTFKQLLPFVSSTEQWVWWHSEWGTSTLFWILW